MSANSGRNIADFYTEVMVALIEKHCCRSTDEPAGSTAHAEQVGKWVETVAPSVRAAADRLFAPQ